MKLNKHLLILGIPLLVFAAAGCSGENENKQDQRQKGRSLSYTRDVAFLTIAGDTLTTIKVAVADDQQERSEGLMDVNNLPQDKGMLFIFENQQPLSFWMANTPLSLDIIFVNEAKEIVRIHQNTQPFTEENFKSGEPAKYVIETNAGFCLSHDIQEGMKVAF